jgi:hypothetical protein
MWCVVASGGRLAVTVCGPLAAAGAYAVLAEIAERVCAPGVVDLLRSPFALGDRERLAGLVRTSGIDGAEIRTVECPVRFPSIDALVHTEIKASPIRDIIDAASFNALLEGARERLEPFSVDDNRIGFGMPAHLLIARKG